MSYLDETDIVDMSHIMGFLFLKPLYLMQAVFGLQSFILAVSLCASQEYITRISKYPSKTEDFTVIS